MNIDRMLKTVKGHPDSSKMGMIASHMGLVRETSLNGDPVKGINVRFDHEAIEAIIKDAKKHRVIAILEVGHHGKGFKQTQKCANAPEGVNFTAFENKLIFENQSMVLDAVLQALLKE